MNVLVVNCGSSSLKAALIEPKTGRRLGSVSRERVGDGDRNEDAEEGLGI